MAETKALQSKTAIVTGGSRVWAAASPKPWRLEKCGWASYLAMLPA